MLPLLPAWSLSTLNLTLPFTLGSITIHHLLSKPIFFGSLLTSFSTSLSGSTGYLPVPESPVFLLDLLSIFVQLFA